MWLKTNTSYIVVINMNLFLQSILIYQISYLNGVGRESLLSFFLTLQILELRLLNYHSHQECETTVTMLLYQEHSKIFSIIKINRKKILSITIYSPFTGNSPAQQTLCQTLQWILFALKMYTWLEMAWTLDPSRPFPAVMYGCESWSIKKAEHWRIAAFELWCWRRLLRVPWTARRSSQWILKEISSEYSLEGLMLKLKLQYFGHLMWRTDSLEKTLILGKVVGWRKRGQQRMKWLDGLTNWMDMSVSKL